MAENWEGQGHGPGTGVWEQPVIQDWADLKSGPSAPSRREVTGSLSQDRDVVPNCRKLQSCLDSAAGKGLLHICGTRGVRAERQSQCLLPLCEMALLPTR